MKFISRFTNTNRREQASEAKKYSFMISNPTVTMQTLTPDNVSQTDQSPINEFQIQLKHLELLQKALSQTNYRFEAITSAMFTTNVNSAILQINEYHDALKVAKPDTAKRLKEISDALNILFGLFENTFSTGTLFMNGYLMQEKINFELKHENSELKKKIVMLEDQLSRK